MKLDRPVNVVYGDREDEERWRLDAGNRWGEWWTDRVSGRDA